MTHDGSTENGHIQRPRVNIGASLHGLAEVHAAGEVPLPIFLRTITVRGRHHSVQGSELNKGSKNTGTVRR